MAGDLPYQPPPQAYMPEPSPPPPNPAPVSSGTVSKWYSIEKAWFFAREHCHRVL